MQFSKSKFMEYLAQKGVAGRAVIEALTDFWGAYEERATLSAGSGVAGGPKEVIITVPIPPGSPFEPDLFLHNTLDATPAATGIVTAAVTRDAALINGSLTT